MRQGFDDPVALSGVLMGSASSGLATGLCLADAPFPRPDADAQDIQRFFLGNAGPERISVSVAGLAGRLGDRGGGAHRRSRPGRGQGQGAAAVSVRFRARCRSAGSATRERLRTSSYGCAPTLPRS
jgi:hypothetical protein